MTPTWLKCQICGGYLPENARPDQRYCSKACKCRAYYQRKTANHQTAVMCAECGGELPTPHNQQRRYCSEACRAKAYYHQTRPNSKRREAINTLKKRFRIWKRKQERKG